MRILIVTVAIVLTAGMSAEAASSETDIPSASTCREVARPRPHSAHLKAPTQ